MTLSALKRAAEQAINEQELPRPPAGCALVPLAWLEFLEARDSLDPQTVLKLIKAVEALQEITGMGSNTDPWPPEAAMRKVARRALQELGL